MRVTGLGLVLLMAVMAGGLTMGTTTAENAAEDAAAREAVINHIHSIFRAYLRKDRVTLRNTHTKDWTGFQGPSTKIERGIDDYMINAEKSLQNLDGTAYEIIDTEVQFYGEIAIVYYVATYSFRTKDGEPGVMPLRSLDIYRKQSGGWIQCGSHITPIPGGGMWGEGDQNRK